MVVQARGVVEGVTVSLLLFFSSCLEVSSSGILSTIPFVYHSIPHELPLAIISSSSSERSSLDFTKSSTAPHLHQPTAPTCLS